MSSQDSDDDAPVLVDIPDENEDISSAETKERVINVESPFQEALQIISVGTEEDAFAFTFLEDNLNSILSQIPPGWKVAVVSVVGAFRTGKSFLLSWFLRYLHHLSEKKEETTEKWYSKFQTLGNDGFDWRGGAERNTTGIWMWKKPHFIEENGEQIAVLLVDTQGMFDNETTMALTASIFGLSTLLSSYQIYNVEKRIQEDNLQQLALFSEYARMAMSTHEKASEDTHKPFQKIEFLVRDWQNFEEEEDYEAMEKEMEEYLDKVIADREAKDLQDTREQIRSCFEDVSCYAMTHPGMAVTKKKYTGDVKAMDETFLNLVDRYCARVFSQGSLKPKTIRGREITAVELGTYVKAYAELFASGAHFPEAATLLEATASANNTNAINLALTEYKDQMSRIAGPHCSNYIKPEELKELHEQVVKESLEVFDSIAAFGNPKAIEKAREKVTVSIKENFEMYSSLNDSRNPLAGMEAVLLPIIVAFVSYIVRWIMDLTCSGWSSVCRASSDMLSHVFAVVMFFMLIIGFTKAKQISEALLRVKAALELLADGGKAKKD
jgi:atlastin